MGRFDGFWREYWGYGMIDWKFIGKWVILLSFSNLYFGGRREKDLMGIGSSGLGRDG